MNSFSITAAAIAIASATGHIAAAEPRDPINSGEFGEIVEVPASQVLSPRELHRLGLTKDDIRKVTLAPRGVSDTSHTEKR